MRVLVLGGYGLIGSGIVRRLLADGLAVTGLGRSIGRAREAMPAATWIAADIATLRRPEQWMPCLVGIDAVVNAAGALQDAPGTDLADLQDTSMRALWQACDAAGIRRVVQISAAGAAPTASTTFMRTKAAADAALAASSLDWTVLRPGLVIADRAYGGTALLRSLAASPGMIPLVYPAARLRTVALTEVADAVAAALQGTLPARCVYDLVEAEPQRLDAIVLGFRAWLGMPPVRVKALPIWVAVAAAGVANALGYLGWRSPIRSTAMRVIAEGVDGDPEPYRVATGIVPSPFHETLSRIPNGAEDGWFARLYLLKPAVFAGLALFWFASGLVGFLYVPEAAGVLTRAGISTPLAGAIVYLGSFVDVLLALLVCHRRTAKTALIGMLGVSIAYLVGATALTPGLWLDPLGPLVKIIPATLLVLVALAILEDR